MTRSAGLNNAKQIIRFLRSVTPRPFDPSPKETRVLARVPATGETSTHPVDLNTAAGKLLAILDAFGPDKTDFTLAELALRSHLPKATTHRLLAMLGKWGGVERSSVGRYQLGARFLELGDLVDPRLRLRRLALPYMENLRLMNVDAVDLAELRDNAVVYIERLGTSRRPPPELPASCTAIGKVILAFSPPGEVEAIIAAGLPALTPSSITDPRVLLDEMERTRHMGLSYESEEALSGRLAVAGPILDQEGQVIAAIGVSGHVGQISLDLLQAAVRVSALALSRELGCSRPLRLPTAACRASAGLPAATRREPLQRSSRPATGSERASYRLVIQKRGRL